MESRIELLLEKMVAINMEMIQKMSLLIAEVQSLKEHVIMASDCSEPQSAVNQIIQSIKEVNDELDWSNELSTGYKIIEAIEEVKEELDWSKDLSFAKTIVDSVNEVSEAIEGME